MSEFGITPSRALGQNFLVDANTVRKIAWLAKVGGEHRVIEIGAGLGCLTLALAETGAHVTAIEIDKYVLPALRKSTAELDNVQIIEGNAMEVVWDDVASPKDGPYVVVANLPYNIATPLIATLLDEVPQVSKFLVMVQREAGERLVASRGSKAFGAVSLKVAYWAEAKLVGNVGRTVFIPQPNVDSVLVEIVRRPAPVVDVARDQLFAFIKAGFAQRRKMLRKSLGALVGPDALRLACVPETARAEELSLNDWARIVAANAATGESATGESATGESATGESATGESATGEAVFGESAGRRSMPPAGVGESGVRQHGTQGGSQEGLKE